MDMGLVVVCDCSLNLIFCLDARDLMLRLSVELWNEAWCQVCSRWNNGVVEDVM